MACEHGSVDAGRSARASPVLPVRAGSAARPRRRQRALRRDGRLRDVGDARRAGDERRPRLPRVDRRQPRHRAGGTWSRHAGLVGGDGRAGSADRHQPVVRRVRQRAGWLPGIDRSRLAAPRRRPAVRFAVPGRHDPRHGAGAGSTRRRPRRPCLARHRGRLDGRDAGPRVGDHVPAPGPLDPAHRHVHAGDGAADRVGQHRPPGDHARPAVARRRLLRRRRGSHRRLGRRPDGRPGHVPQRQRLHRPLRPRPHRLDRRRRQVRAVAAVRGGDVPRPPRQQARCGASTPTATS